jgi:hypothetical protein
MVMSVVDKILCLRLRLTAIDGPKQNGGGAKILIFSHFHSLNFVLGLYTCWENE